MTATRAGQDTDSLVREKRGHQSRLALDGRYRTFCGT